MKVNISILLFFVLVYNVYPSGNDSVKVKLPERETILHFNPLMLFDNSSVLYYNKIEASGVNFFSKLERGDMKRVYDPEKRDVSGINTFGYLERNNVHYFGEFSYSQNNDYGLNSGNRLFVYSDNPLYTGDYVRNNYKKKIYSLNSGISFKLNKKIIIGTGIEHQTIYGAICKDPRTENIYLNFRFTPSVIFELRQIKIGITGIIKIQNEEVDYDWLNDEQVWGYMNRGLGFYQKVDAGDPDIEKEYLRNGYGGKILIAKTGKFWSNIFEIGYVGEKEYVEDNRKKNERAGVFDKMELSLKYLLEHKSNIIKRLVLSYNYYDMSLKEKYIMGYKSELGEQIPIYGDQTNYNHDLHKASLLTSFIKYKKGYLNWSADIGADFIMDKPTYQFSGKHFKEINNLNLHINFEKNIALKYGIIKGEIYTSYLKTLSNKISAYDYSKNYLNKDKGRHSTEYYYDYLFDSSDKMDIRANIGFKYNKTKDYKPYIMLGYKYSKLLQSDLDVDNRRLFTVSLGFNF